MSLDTITAIVIVGALVWKFATHYSMTKEVRRCPHCDGQDYGRVQLDPSPYAIGLEETSELNHARACPNFR